MDKGNQTTLVKWRFVPEDGEKELSDAELASSPPDFLEQVLIDRTNQGLVRWDMWVTIGEPCDPQTDPTVAWPQGRKEIKAGTLTITEAMRNQARCARKSIMIRSYERLDCGNRRPGARLSLASYAISYVKRLQGK
jgi:catalase